MSTFGTIVISYCSGYKVSGSRGGFKTGVDDVVAVVAVGDVVLAVVAEIVVVAT